jgi:23S rRNA (guanosine2251-2'-O)-methyltransferase
MEEGETTLIYGRHPILEAIEVGKTIEKILFQQGLRGELEKEIRHLCRDHEIPLQVVPKEKMNRVVSGNHQGVIAYTSPMMYQKIEALLPEILKKKGNPLLLILDSITDVRNIGAIARSAEVLGADGIILGMHGTAPINADAIKASAGALTRIPVCRENSLANTVTYLQEMDLVVQVSDLKGDKLVNQCNWREATAIILGAEGSGVHPSLLKAADQKFIIPQHGEINSLNVSVAAGIILYEVMRQRNLRM